ncbi:PREDICTED: uncharacterized protein LOC107164319 [Diuraphis noxia]|uniref:uncharacterized protein LOC107164319 n=1 Tax=Diuraphis noxia TaxID=143948 RepID=UPI000763716E|nr:PREDICTED: uncharacterized protein LOC107164319 [Diuraphis noxia]
MSVVAFSIVQIMGASSPELHYCPMCGIPNDNPYNSPCPTCSCNINYQNYQTSVCPTNTPYPYFSAQNIDRSCPSELSTGHVVGSSCNCAAGGFPYEIQVPPNVQPSPTKVSYPYVSEDPAHSPCQQTLKNFGYQLQIPVAHRRDSNYGSLSGIVDKIYKKCTPCNRAL